MQFEVVCFVFDAALRVTTRWLLRQPVPMGGAGQACDVEQAIFVCQGAAVLIEIFFDTRLGPANIQLEERIARRIQFEGSLRRELHDGRARDQCLRPADHGLARLRLSMSRRRARTDEAETGREHGHEQRGIGDAGSVHTQKLEINWPTRISRASFRLRRAAY